MAHTVTSRTYIDDLLKYVYGPMVREQTPEHALLLKKLQTITAVQTHGGKSFNMAVQYDSKGAAGSFAEGDSLPVSVPGNWDLTTIPFYWHYFGIALSGQAIATSASDVQAFSEALARETLVKQRAFHQNMNREACSDGNGMLCQADGDDDGAGNITVDNAGGWSGYNSSAVNGHRYLSTNMYVNFRNSSGTARTAGLLISGITRGAYPSTSAIIAVTGTSTDIADGDYCYVAGSATASHDSYGHEMPGIKMLIDDNTVAATVQGISATTYPEWRSQIGYGAAPGTAEALTTLRMMNLWSDIMVEGDGNVSFIATSPGVWVTYGHMADQLRQVVNPDTLDVAYPSLNFAGIPVFQDKYLPDEMFFVDPSTLAFYQPLEAGWITDSAGAVMHQVAGASAARDEQEGYWRWYVTLGISNRAKNGKLTDISVIANKY